MQTGMRGAFGKACGRVARVSIGKILMSIRCKEKYRKQALEALRRAAFKFPGRQKIFVAKTYGFTSILRKEMPALKKEGRISFYGNHVKVATQHGPLANYLRKLVPKG